MNDNHQASYFILKKAFFFIVLAFGFTQGCLATANSAWACAESADCPSGQYCRSRMCLPYPLPKSDCNRDEDCERWERCKPVDGVKLCQVWGSSCYPGSYYHMRGCPNLQKCVGHLCVTPEPILDASPDLSPPTFGPAGPSAADACGCQSSSFHSPSVLLLACVLFLLFLRMHRSKQ